MPPQSFAFKRMQLLEARFNLHKMLNQDKVSEVLVCVCVRLCVTKATLFGACTGADGSEGGASS